MTGTKHLITENETRIFWKFFLWLSHCQHLPVLSVMRSNYQHLPVISVIRSYCQHLPVISVIRSYCQHLPVISVIRSYCQHLPVLILFYATNDQVNHCLLYFLCNASSIKVIINKGQWRRLGWLLTQWSTGCLLKRK